MLYKVLPVACLVASASAFSVAPMLTSVRAPALANLASAHQVAGTVSLSTPTNRPAPLLRKGRASLAVKMVATSGVTTGNVPLTGSTLKASLKMRCDTSGAGYAIYWANVNGKLVVASDYVTDERKAENKANKMPKSFAEESESVTLDANGSGPIATVMKTNAPLFIKDVATSNLQRKDLAIKYGIGQIAFVPFEGGILEFGTSNGASTADWKEMPQCPTMPKAAMRRGFENLGASYNIFWAKKGDKFEAIADYTTEARKSALKQIRGDDKTFASESRSCTDIDANGSGPIATAFKSGKEVTVTDVSTLKRAALAKEFGIQRMHFVPTEGGVLEYGTPANSYLSGSALDASLKMRCDTSGAGYAMYWKEVDGKVTVAGSYLSDKRRAHLEKTGVTKSFAEATKDIVLSSTGDGPVATVLKSREPVYIADAANCPTMKRKGLAEEYGIKSICLVPVQGGVMEYGVSNGPCTADWKSIDDARTAIMPKSELENAFKSGATHTIFWRLDAAGTSYEWGADFVTPERLRMLKNARGDDKSFTSESKSMTFPASGEGPVASAARSGMEVVIEDPSSSTSFKRSALAKEFGIGNIHFVPCKDGVLEYGTGKSV